MGTVAVPVKASEKLRELIDKYKIELEVVREMLAVFEVLIIEIAKKAIEIVERTIEEEAKRKALSEEIQRKARELSEKLKHISDEEIAALIREDRDSR